MESWLETFRFCKDRGLNLMRFKGYCPPEAAFTAADRLGFYLQPDIPAAQGEETNRVIERLPLLLLTDWASIYSPISLQPKAKRPTV